MIEHILTKNENFLAKNQQFLVQNEHLLTQNEHLLAKNEHFLTKKFGSVFYRAPHQFFSKNRLYVRVIFKLAKI